MIFTISLVSVLVFLANAEKIRFDNHQMYRVLFQNDTQYSVLHSIRHSNESDNLFWDDIIHNDYNDFIVPPKKTEKLELIMQNNGLQFEVLTKNVQELIDKQLMSLAIPKSRYEFASHYHTLDEIYSYLQRIEKLYPQDVRVEVGGYTYENRTIRGVRLFPGKNKPRIFIEGGMHAREWISTATVIFLMNELLHNKKPAILALKRDYEFYLFPTVNPDGYVYTHEVDRFWRKTRSYNGDPQCYGVDPNRNFGFQWTENLRPCTESYSGKGPFSEIETRSLADYLLSIRENLFAYISFHSYSQLLMFPYGHTTEHLENYDESMSIAQKAARSLARRYGTKYKVGNIAETIYKATGSSIDWIKATLRLPVTYVYELRDGGHYGFLLPPDQIIPTGQETIDSLITLFKEAKKYGYGTV